MGVVAAGGVGGRCGRAAPVREAVLELGGVAGQAGVRVGRLLLLGWWWREGAAAGVRLAAGQGRRGGRGARVAAALLDGGDGGGGLLQVLADLLLERLELGQLQVLLHSEGGGLKRRLDSALSANLQAAGMLHAGPSRWRSRPAAAQPVRRGVALGRRSACPGPVRPRPRRPACLLLLPAAKGMQVTLRQCARRAAALLLCCAGGAPLSSGKGSSSSSSSPYAQRAMAVRCERLLKAGTSSFWSRRGAASPSSILPPSCRCCAPEARAAEPAAGAAWPSSPSCCCCCLACRICGPNTRFCTPSPRLRKARFPLEALPPAAEDAAEGGVTCPGLGSSILFRGPLDRALSWSEKFAHSKCHLARVRRIVQT